MQPVSQVKDVADAKAVRQECAWHVGTATGLNWDRMNRGERVKENQII